MIEELEHGTYEDQLADGLCEFKQTIQSHLLRLSKEQASISRVYADFCVQFPGVLDDMRALFCSTVEADKIMTQLELRRKRSKLMACQLESDRSEIFNQVFGTNIQRKRIKPDLWHSQGDFQPEPEVHDESPFPVCVKCRDQKPVELIKPVLADAGVQTKKEPKYKVKHQSTQTLKEKIKRKKPTLKAEQTTQTEGAETRSTGTETMII